MKHILSTVTLIAGLALSSMRAVASPLPDVERMSDIEVSEYAVQMSSVLESIQYRLNVHIIHHRETRLLSPSYL